MTTNESNGGGGCRTKEVTGRTVLVCLVAFFGVVFAVNAVMVRAAISTFAGVETESSYQAGFTFTRDVAEARSQDALHWRVDARLTPLGNGNTRLQVEARDAAGRRLGGLVATARFVHPTDERGDRAVPLEESQPGEFRGSADAVAGQWDLVLELARDGTRVFRSKNRVVVR
ncbi:MAG TPA: FixH family protein [Xanthobacteraceae bacterium]